MALPPMPIPPRPAMPARPMPKKKPHPQALQRDAMLQKLTQMAGAPPMTKGC